VEENKATGEAAEDTMTKTANTTTTGTAIGAEIEIGAMATNV